MQKVRQSSVAMATLCFLFIAASCTPSRTIMAQKDSTYRISGLYVTPNWNGYRDRVAMSCGIGAYIKVLRKVSIGGEVVVIAADTAGTMARSWNMVARNTILRTTAKVYLYARIERSGANGMYIWSANIYNIDGTIQATVPDASVPDAAVNHDQYYYIRVGALEENRIDYEIDEGQYGLDWGDGGKEDVGYNWSDLISWDRARDLLVFLKTVAGLAIEYIILAGHELNRVLTRNDDENEDSDNAVVTAGFLQKWVNKIKGMFLRKDQDDKTPHTLTMGEAISNVHHTERFSATSGAMDGVGAGMWMLEDGTGIMETDLFYVRRAAYFRSLTIAEVKHMGGEVILSAAACQIAYVVPYAANGTPITTAVPDGSPSGSIAFYRCYFEKRANGREVYNEWMVGDQARCQRFDATGQEVQGSFYWRLVVGTGEDADFYNIDLSFADCATGSNPPKSNDNIVLFGHRNPTAATYDRTCAQMYSTVGVSAPSRTYFSLITSYDLTTASRIEHLGVVNPATGEVEWVVGDGEHYIKYNTRTGLDIRTSSMTVIADGKDVSVGEALGENFQFITSSDKAPTVNGEVAKWIPADDIDPSDGWSLEEKDSHVGDYLITSDGFTYEFVRDDSGSVVSHGWKISSDEYLIHAQETANAAIQNLDEMASDGMITAQEKSTIIADWTSTESEHTSIIEEAFNNDIDPYAYNEAYLRLEAFVNYFRSNREGTTPLVDEELGVLVVTKGLLGAYVVNYSKTVGQDYINTYSDYYYSLSELRRDISFAIRRYVAQIDGKPIDEVIDRELTTLKEKYASIEGSITEFSNLRTAIIQKTGGNITGLVMKSEMDAAFSVMYAENEQSRAEIYAYVDKSVSGITLSADKIDFSAESITVFSQNLQIASDVFSLYNDADGSKVIEIHTDNFNVNRNGSASFRGEVTADGGFRLGFRSVQLNESSQNSAPLLSSDMIVLARYTGDCQLILPTNPYSGQVLKIIALNTAGYNLKVVPGYGKKLLRGATQLAYGTIDANYTGEFVYDGTYWYYISLSAGRS